jgi:transposase
MASLQKVRVQGRPYWRLVESRRINGKPRAIPILYLGTADALLNRLLASPAGSLTIQSFQHGDVAALKAVADRLDVVATIDQHVGGHARSPSVGTTLLLAAINRVVQPCSKRGWAAWAGATSLAQLFPGLTLERLTSQYFWEQMDGIAVATLQAIEDELTRTVVTELGIELDTLFYDTTNFFTYIASTNERSTLTQRGHSKQKRHDLRLFNLALLVSRHAQLPLCADVYEGNRVDVSRFPESLTRIRERLEALSLSLQDVTLVYDKGNHSRANQAQVDEAPFGYVASLVPTHHPELLAIPARDYRIQADSGLGAIPRLRLRRQIWERERTVVLFISEQLRIGQRRGLQQHLSKRLQQLAEWQTQLAKPRSGPRTPAAAQQRIDQLLTGQYLKQVLKIDYDPERQGAERLHYEVDEAARQHLETQVFGKRMLITDRHDWSDEEILRAYRGQSHVEATFRQLKDDEHLAVRPQYHWTDQKVRVHTFICLLGLLLARVIEFEARRLGYRQGLSGLLERLGTVRLARVLQPAPTPGGRPRCRWQLEQSEPEAVHLFRHLVPTREPFVYT